MGAGGSHSQAMSDPGEGEMAEGEQQRNEEKEEPCPSDDRARFPFLPSSQQHQNADENTEGESNQEEVRRRRKERNPRDEIGRLRGRRGEGGR